MPRPAIKAASIVPHISISPGTRGPPTAPFVGLALGLVAAVSFGAALVKVGNAVLVSRSNVVFGRITPPGPIITVSVPNTSVVGWSKSYVVPEITTSLASSPKVIPSITSIDGRGAAVVCGNTRPSGPAVIVSDPKTRVLVGAPGPIVTVVPEMTAKVEPMSKVMPSIVSAVKVAAGAKPAGSESVDDPAIMAEGSIV